MSNARTPEQLKKMKKLTDDGICAFCPERFNEFHDNPINFETKHWVVTKNDYPYEHTTLHLLLIAKKHVQMLGQLTVEARADMTEVIARIENDFRLTTYGFGMRGGDFRFNGGTVDHLHGHIIVGDFSDRSNHHKVRFKISSVPDLS